MRQNKTYVLSWYEKKILLYTLSFSGHLASFTCLTLNWQELKLICLFVVDSSTCFFMSGWNEAHLHPYCDLFCQIVLSILASDLAVVSGEKVFERNYKQGRFYTNRFIITQLRLNVSSFNYPVLHSR